MRDPSEAPRVRGTTGEGTRVVRIRTKSVVLGTLLVLVLPGRAWAAPGDLDTTFGFDGIASDFAGCGGSCNFPNDVTILEDGRLVEVGVVNTESEEFFGISGVSAVFTRNGDFVDYGFGADRLDLNAFRAIAPHPDGGAVTAGWAQRCRDGQDPCQDLSPSFFMVAKSLPSGAPDPSFDADGVVVTWMGPGGGYANGVAVQPDGSIVVVGPVTDAVGNPQIAVVRYLPDGSRDPAFGDDGRVLLPGGTANDVEVSSGGKIVIAGQASPTGFLVLRLLEDGMPDPGFGDNGVVTGLTDRTAGANDVALAPGPRILVGGMVEDTDPVAGTIRGLGLMRLLWDGTPDDRFHHDGQVVTFMEGGWSWVDELVITADRDIVAGGGFGVVRYTKKGARDTTFGGDGRRSYPWEIEGLVLQGNRVVMGINDWTNGMGLTRILL